MKLSNGLQNSQNTKAEILKKLKIKTQMLCIPMLVLMLSIFMVSNRKGQESIKETQKTMLSRLVKTKKFPGDQSLIAISSQYWQMQTRRKKSYELLRFKKKPT